MNKILIDGSNIALHGARTGKLQNLDTLSRVLNCLLTNDTIPYTIFDASFRWHLADSSPALTHFQRLTKTIPEYFQMSPRGEKADLFLLEMAHATGFPVLSNDTFQELGGTKSGILTYKGKALSILNFQVFAGVVVIPDLDVRRPTEPGDTSTEDFEDKVEAVLAGRVAPASPEASNPDAEISSDQPVPEGDQQSIQLKPGELAAIARVINRFIRSGHKTTSELALRLKPRRDTFREAAGLGIKNPRRWFGYRSLDDFIRARLPQFRIKDGKIDKPD